MSERCTDTPDLFGDDLADAVEQLADTPGRWPAQLVGMTDLVLDEVQAILPRLDPPEARRLAYRIVARFSREYGGDHLYVPKPDALVRVLRDLALWAEHDGTVDGPKGINALARRHGLSSIRVWSILKAQRELHRRRVQMGLFDEPDHATGGPV